MKSLDEFRNFYQTDLRPTLLEFEGRRKKICGIIMGVSLGVIGMGGICDCTDMVEFIMAGASAISLGTMNLIDPLCAEKIHADFKIFLHDGNFSDYCELIGAAHNN